MPGRRGGFIIPFVKRAVAASLVYAAVLLLTPPITAQWPRQQTPGVPRNADGSPNLTAAAPRTPDGKPDLSGLWNYAGVLGLSRRPAARAAGHARRGDVLEHRGRLQGGPAVPAVGRGAAQEAHGRQQQGQPRRGLPADGPHAAAHALAATQDRPDAGSDRHHLRGQRRAAPDLPGRPRGARQRPSTVVVRLLARLVGRRHAGGRDDELPRRGLAGRERRAADRPPASSSSGFAGPRSAGWRSTSPSTTPRPTRGRGRCA